MFSRVRLLVPLAVLLVVGGTPNALAATRPPETVASTQAAAPVPVPVPVTPAAAKAIRSANATPASTKCYEWQPYVYIENGLGENLAHFYQHIYWCENGSIITYHGPGEPFGAVQGTFWEYKGLLSKVSSGGSGSSFWQLFSQGNFCLDIPGAGCVEYWQPWIRTTVYGNGGYKWEHG